MTVGAIISICMITLLVLLLLSVPIAVSLGLSTIVAMWLGDIPMSMFITRSYAQFDSFPLMAIPFFILAGDIMRFGTIANRLLDFCRVMVGHMHAGLANISILTCLFYGSLCGSAAATVASVGNIMVPAMTKEGYPLNFSTAVNATSGVLGSMIPPSVVLILYGAFGNVSIGDLFIATVLPGILMGLLFCLTGTFISYRYGYGVRHPKSSWKERWHVFNAAKWALGVPVIVLGTIYSGICTPTEAGAISVLYCMLIETFVSKSMSWALFKKIIISSLHTLGMFFFIITIANAFGTIMVYYDLQILILDLMKSITHSSTSFLALIIVVFILLGTFLDGAVIMLIMTPLLMPLVKSYGIDPVHFGVVTSFCMCIGFMTPPVGTCLFVGCSISGIDILTLAKSVLPFVLLMVAFTIVLAYCPVLSLCLL